MTAIFDHHKSACYLLLMTTSIVAIVVALCDLLQVTTSIVAVVATLLPAHHMSAIAHVCSLSGTSSRLLGVASPLASPSWTCLSARMATCSRTGVIPALLATRAALPAMPAMRASPTPLTGGGLYKNSLLRSVKMNDHELETYESNYSAFFIDPRAIF